MARTFSGSSQYMSVPLDLSRYAKLSVSFWMYWDSFANTNTICFEYGTTGGQFSMLPNGGNGQFTLTIGGGTAGAYWSDSFTRPAAAEWRHYLITMDRSVPAIQAYVNGVAQSLNTVNHGAGTYGNWANNTMYFMSRNGGSLFGAGRLAHVAFWGGVIYSLGEAQHLSKHVCPLKYPDNLVLYMPLVGNPYTRDPLYSPYGNSKMIPTYSGTSISKFPYDMPVVGTSTKIGVFS